MSLHTFSDTTFFYNVTFFIYLQDRKNIEIIKQNNL